MCVCVCVCVQQIYVSHRISYTAPVQPPPPVKVHLQNTIFKTTNIYKTPSLKQLIPMHSAIGHFQKSSESTRINQHIPFDSELRSVYYSIPTFSQTVTRSSLIPSTESSRATNSANKEAANQKIGALSKLSKQQKCCHKLTLPEEIKENEYMSAIQRQKVRVSTIHRCILATTVIQRAWRNHIQRWKA